MGVMRLQPYTRAERFDRAEWSTATTVKPWVVNHATTPGPPRRAQADHQQPTVEGVGTTTIVRARVNGRKANTRPAVGAAGCTKLTCRVHDDRGCRNISTPAHPGWCHRALNGSFVRGPGGITFV